MFDKINYHYFQHSNCEYFPCHDVDDIVNFNCLFCYCPLYWDHGCPGNPDYSGGIKDCSKCAYPHKAENYFNIVDLLARRKTMTKEAEEKLVYTGGYIPSTDLTQDDIDKVKKMIDRLNSTDNMIVMCAQSEEELKE